MLLLALQVFLSSLIVILSLEVLQLFAVQTKELLAPRVLLFAAISVVGRDISLEPGVILVSLPLFAPAFNVVVGDFLHIDSTRVRLE